MEPDPSPTYDLEIIMGATDIFDDYTWAAYQRLSKYLVMKSYDVAE